MNWKSALKIILILILFSMVCGCLSNEAPNATLRELDTPIPDATTFSTIVQTVIDTNPFGCADYVVGGVEYNGVTLVEGDYDAFYCKLMCHDSDRGLYFVTFTSDEITVSSFDDPVIPEMVWCWVDTVPELAGHGVQ